MNPDDVDTLASRIGELGGDVKLETFLGALGIVVMQAMQQYQPEERMAVTVSWVAVLTNQMLNDYRRSKSN